MVESLIPSPDPPIPVEVMHILQSNLRGLGGKFITICASYSPRLCSFLLSPKQLKISLQAYLVLLCFALLHFSDTAFFTNGNFVATLHCASLLGPFFQQHYYYYF